MDLNVDLKVPLATPDGVSRTLVVTLNPFTVAKTKEFNVKVIEEGKDGAFKSLGGTKLALGSILGMVKQAQAGG